MGALELQFAPGAHIDYAAKALVEAANLAQGAAVGTFNDVTMWVLPGADPAEVVTGFHREMEAKAAAYRASPAGQAAAEKSAAEVAALQAQADALAAGLGALDFTDHAAVIDFLAALQPCSDRIGVTVRADEIVEAFAGAGLTPNMRIGDAFNAEDEETFYRWLVGQALDGLTRGPAIHGIFHKFADEWRAKWGRA